MPKLKASSQVVNLVKKKKKGTPTFLGRIYIQKSFHALYDQCRATSMWSAVSASWDFPVTHCRMYDVKWHISSKRRLNKGKAMGNMLKISHFMGCETPSLQHLDVIWAEMLFTKFFVVHIIILYATNHVSGKLNSEGGHPTSVTMLKIRFCDCGGLAALWRVISWDMVACFLKKKCICVPVCC